MADLKGVDIQRGKIGVLLERGADAISGLLANGPAIVPVPGKAIGLEVGKVLAITSPEEAESYGITSDYDSTNKVRVYRHISEFFRIAGKGTKLYIMLYTGKPTDALTNAIYAQKLLSEAKGEIKQLAVAYNPAAAYTPVMVDGLETDVREAIAKAQELYAWAWNLDMPLQIVLEGRGLNAATAAEALNLRNITAGAGILEAFKVSLCVAQDWDYAETQDAIGKKMADVGTMLGSISYMQVNHNIGEVENMNLTDALYKKWISAGFSNHKTASEMQSQWSAYDDKGYIFPIFYAGQAGFYWNGDHTCTHVKIDEQNNVNEHCIAFGRTHDKAVRLLKTQLLPKVKSTQPVDAKTGLLPIGVVKYFEKIGDAAFDKMLKNAEITYGKTYVDKNSNLLTPPHELKVSFEVVPTGIVGVIRGTINLKTKIA